jgi:diguanylate cyclase (GGDEF)-like protein
MRVVLVNPRRATAKFVRRLLEARDHEVKVFADGVQALACVKTDAGVGALITSAEPLSISGLELCWEARLMSTSQRPIYVMMMSAATGDRMLVEALDSGADDFLIEPPFAEELYARLRAAERFAAMQRELVRLATTDPLTGMLNRRAFFERANDLCTRAAAGEALSAIMMDVDHFKRVNDVHGHKAGDDALCAVAGAVMTEGGAIAGRLGGEEFALLLGGNTMAESIALAERLRSRISALKIETAKATIALTCSFGVSEWRSGDTIDRLLKRADVALYKAKLGGRNRVLAGHSVEAPQAYREAGRPVRTTGR